MKIKFIELYQYYQKTLFFIYKRYYISFRRSMIDDYFSIIINKVFLNNLNNKICYRIYRFKISNFNNNIYIKFNLFSFNSLTLFIKKFNNYNISRNYI